MTAEQHNKIYGWLSVISGIAFVIFAIVLVFITLRMFKSLIDEPNAVANMMVLPVGWLAGCAIFVCLVMAVLQAITGWIVLKQSSTVRIWITAVSCLLIFSIVCLPQGIYGLWLVLNKKGAEFYHSIEEKAQQSGIKN